VGDKVMGIFVSKGPRGTGMTMMSSYLAYKQRAELDKNKIPKSPKKLWILFGYKGLFWRLCKVMGIRHAWKQARFK